MQTRRPASRLRDGENNVPLLHAGRDGDRHDVGEVAAVQLGPNVAAPAVELHTGLGMPPAKVARVLENFQKSLFSSGAYRFTSKSEWEEHRPVIRRTLEALREAV